MHRNTFDLNSRQISVQFMPVSCNDRRYSPQISARLSSDPTHYVRVGEVREGVTETPQREASASLKSASWPVNLLCCAALDWTDGRTATSHGRFPSSLENALTSSYKNVSRLEFSLQTVRTYLSRHLKGETLESSVSVCHTPQTWRANS